MVGGHERRSHTHPHTKTDPGRPTVLVGGSWLRGPILAERPSVRDRLTARWRPRPARPRAGRRYSARGERGARAPRPRAHRVRAPAVDRRRVSPSATGGSRGRAPPHPAGSGPTGRGWRRPATAERARRHARRAGAGGGRRRGSGMAPAHGRDRAAVQRVQPHEPWLARRSRRQGPASLARVIGTAATTPPARRDEAIDADCPARGGAADKLKARAPTPPPAAGRPRPRTRRPCRPADAWRSRRSR